MEVPYDLETINNILGIQKEWKNLNQKERWNLIGKLKPSFFDKIIRKINGIDSPDNDLKKN